MTKSRGNRTVPGIPLASLESDNTVRTDTFSFQPDAAIDTSARNDGDGAFRATTSKIPLASIIDSPYQPRLRYDPAQIDSLGAGLAAVGLQEPILVRRLNSGQFELISGHRRKRAAVSIGWTEIAARIVEIDDETAEKLTLVQNEGREDLSDYERAKIFIKALDKGFVGNQVECAQFFSTSQATVSKCLSILTLPNELIHMLQIDPTLFGGRGALIIKDLLKSHPDQEQLIIDGVKRLLESGSPLSSLKTWVSQALAKTDGKPLSRSKSIVTNSSGSTVYEVKAKPGDRQILVSLKDAEESIEWFEQWLFKLLQERGGEKI